MHGDAGARAVVGDTCSEQVLFVSKLDAGVSVHNTMLVIVSNMVYSGCHFNDE